MYRYWTHELEETVKKVEIYMEEACDQYFKDVKPRAVKVHSLRQAYNASINFNWFSMQYFYREYCLKTRGYLDEFDDDFEEQLKRENERQKKV